MCMVYSIYIFIFVPVLCETVHIAGEVVSARASACEQLEVRDSDSHASEQAIHWPNYFPRPLNLLTEENMNLQERRQRIFPFSVLLGQ